MWNADITIEMNDALVAGYAHTGKTDKSSGRACCLRVALENELVWQSAVWNHVKFFNHI